MNILRWRRKSKKKIKLKTILLFVFSLIMTTFAWFAYSKVLEPTLDLHIASWDMQYIINGEDWDQDEAIGISTLYPAMPEQTVTIDIKNNGERVVDIDYYVKSVSIAGTTYQLIQEGTTIPEGVVNYIILTPTVTETKSVTDETTQITTITKTVKGAITNDITKFPFTIEVEHSGEIDPKGTDAYGNEVGGEGYLKVTVNWIGDNHELDTQWGHIVDNYFTTNPTATSAISISLAVDSYQIEEETVETVVMPSTTETTPYLPDGFVRVPGTTLDSGLVIEDSSGNEYVWIEVPKNTTVYDTAGLSITEFTTEEYTKIETDLKAYSAGYRTREPNILDHYNALGIAESVYNTLKNKMFKSIYQHGGFYIGRYETGIEGTPRTGSGETSQTPVIKANAYPYNYVTISQAHSLATSMNTDTDYASSLMFGIQWDLVMKYLDTKSVDEEDLKTDSTILGNYYNNTYYVTNSKAKYSLNNGTDWTDAPYEKVAPAALHLTTGSNTTFSIQNIYDLAGNLSEWTYNVIYDGATPIGGNGGDYTADSGETATYCGNYTTTAASKFVGFRVSIY